MPLIDFILNVTGILLWCLWRSMRLEPLALGKPSILASTVKRTEPHRSRGWQYLVGLLALLVARAWVYRQMGSAADWTPKLDLVVVVVPFRSDLFHTVLLYSFLSFLRLWIVFYFWLLALVMINRRVREPGLIEKLLRHHLGWFARWPWPLQLILPILVIAPLWVALQPALVRAGVAGAVRSWGHLIEQALLVSTGVFCSLKYLLPVILFGHLVMSYVYLGSNPLWDFITNTGRNLAAPLRRLPLRLGKFDFAPLVGVVLIFLLLDTLPAFVLRRMSESHLTVWPQ